jgi:DNA-binding CsgD family transcriptional regulator
MGGKREMSSIVGAINLTREDIERLAAKRAGHRAKTAGWDFTLAIAAYAILTTVIILRFEGFGTEFVAPIAVLGLAMILFIHKRRGAQLLERYYAEELFELQEHSQGEKAETLTPSPLTSRETEVIGYVALGYLNKQIADKLGISEQTIKNHISSILRKLDANDRTQAVVMAIRYGWISPQDGESLEFTPKR